MCVKGEKGAKNKMTHGWIGFLVIAATIATSACAAETPEERKKDPVASGIYQTWDDVVNRWIGQPEDKLGYEFGPPTFHKESSDGFTELVWDMTYPNASGQAEMYNTLPLYGGVNCSLVFIVDQDHIVRSGRRIGCD
jgi:hypothetical protein